ncbi:hypothetical protein HPB51_006034 [Rhipicephalus microplus]|uniref:Phospholipase A2-like domain-containing protein n=1 Tax=Rhipicephalus microplus TaxID=6941 RepID=A0A9J6DTL0_RHIMP|nr:hypothetical protein HPB51_006034 [Rhipicephalus microplus]
MLWAPTRSVASVDASQGHRYLGPENALRNGDPVDEEDGIAKSHDEAYEQATITRTSLWLTKHLQLSS